MALFMNYRNYSDLSYLVRNTSRLSRLSFDIVVGIPRSGIVPAAMIALHWNKPLASLEDFAAGRVLGHGQWRHLPGYSEDARTYRRILVVDDSINTGQSLKDAREQLDHIDCEKIFLAIYAHRESENFVDCFLERVAMPRVFEWNMWHHREVCERACFDLDGVLCPNPDRAQNDDGPAYRTFLLGAPRLVVPTFPLAHIVTSRLERYRPETETWLAKAGIRWRHLHMLDLPTAEERRRTGAHAPFKAGVYKRVDTDLFVESEPDQARAIARLSGKPVLDYANRMLVRPDDLSWATLRQQSRFATRRVIRRATAMIGRAFG